MGSSTGALLVADDEGVLAILRKTRRRAAFHSEDEARLNARRALRGRRRSRPPIPCGATRPRRCDRPSASSGSPRGARASACAAYLNARGDRLSASAKDVASCEATPHHLTLSAEDYARLGHELADEPAGARPRPPRRRSGAGSSRGSSTSSAPTTRRIPWRKRPGPTRQPVGHARRADAGSGDAGPRRRGAADPAALRRPDQRRPGAPFRHRRQGPHRRGLRRRLHGRRPEARRDDPRFLDRLALRLDALRRQDR